MYLHIRRLQRERERERNDGLGTKKEKKKKKHNKRIDHPPRNGGPDAAIFGLCRLSYTHMGSRFARLLKMEGKSQNITGAKKPKKYFPCSLTTLHTYGTRAGTSNI